MLDDLVCYSALLSRDARFDGRFFVCVKTTQIYCRPICRVRPPLIKNCSFVSHAAQAESLGYRPCMRCRPELTPGYSSAEASSRLAQSAAGYLQFPTHHSRNQKFRSNQNSLTDLADLADRIGVSARHLRRIFQAEFGVSPLAYLQTHRLLLAKRLLTDTQLPMAMVSEAAGFKSVRRFNDVFQDRYRFSPLKLRKASGEYTRAAFHTVLLAYRPPYDWKAQIDYLKARVIAGVEYIDVEKDCYWRTVAIDVHRADKLVRGWICVRNSSAKSALQVDVSDSLSAELSTVIQLTKKLFDTDARPEDIEEKLRASTSFSFESLLDAHPGLRLAGAFDGFEMAIRAVLGQLVSVKAAHQAASRLIACVGKPAQLANGIEDVQAAAALTRFTPSPAQWCETYKQRGDELAQATRIPSRKLHAITLIAQGLLSGDLQLDSHADIEATQKYLMALPGIGPWTTQYLVMRALGWPDAFPDSDYGVLKILGGTPAQARNNAKQWQPWRAYATRYLWQSS